MTPAAATNPGLNGPWPVLDLKERRVLGVLVEKAKTTPDAYPMSLNGVITGSNQKSNRDPILFLSEEDVEYTLARLQKAGLVIKITGSRVERWRHTLYDTWLIDKIQIAVLGELLVRGPQTEGELRTRASRMEPIDDLDALRAVLRPLVERNLVVYLTPEDRRGAVLTHGFHDPQELMRLRARHMAEPVTVSGPAEAVRTATAPSRTEPASAKMEQALAEAHDEIAALKQTVASLRDDVEAMREELRQLKQSLGA
jgi:uncharacterized protein